MRFGEAYACSPLHPHTRFKVQLCIAGMTGGQIRSDLRVRHQGLNGATGYGVVHTASATDNPAMRVRPPQNKGRKEIEVNPHAGGATLMALHDLLSEGK